MDTVNDYQSLLKPALLCTKVGGKMLVTNNVASVELSLGGDVETMRFKDEREIHDVQVIQPEEDFPSSDGQHPLKMVWLTV